METRTSHGLPSQLEVAGAHLKIMKDDRKMKIFNGRSSKPRDFHYGFSLLFVETENGWMKRHLADA